MSLLLETPHHLIQHQELPRGLDQLLPLVIARGRQGSLLEIEIHTEDCYDGNDTRKHQHTHTHTDAQDLSARKHTNIPTIYKHTNMLYCRMLIAQVSFQKHAT